VELAILICPRREEPQDRIQVLQSWHCFLQLLEAGKFVNFYFSSLAMGSQFTSQLD
jgi:hypothetical protein